MGRDLEDIVRAALDGDDRNGDAWERAIDALCASADAGGLDRALALAADGREAARALACDALGRLGAPSDAARERVIPALIEALDDEAPRVRAAAVSALSRLRDARTIGPLAGRRADPDAEVRHAVACGLGGFDDPLAVDALVDLTRDASPAVRDWATFALGSLTTVTTPAVVEALVERLQDPDEQTREEAIVGLVARRADERVVAALAAALDAAGPIGRGPLEAAARLGDPRLLPALLRVTPASDPERLLLEHAIYACSPEEEEGGAGVS
ncbi:MAG TPA: HEAT repeat domain-containing protein [Thermodesulfobacteriota bacterium]